MIETVDIIIVLDLCILNGIKTISEYDNIQSSETTENNNQTLLSTRK